MKGGVSDLPSILHHHSEVLVSVNASGHVSEVVAELLEGNDTVSNLRVPQRHELHVDLLRVLSSDNVRVLAHIINSCDVIELNSAVAVHVQLVVRLPDKCKTRLIQVTLKNKIKRQLFELVN